MASEGIFSALGGTSGLIGLGGLGLSAFGAISGASAAKKARKANERRQQQIYNLLRMQGEASKADITEQFKGERAGIQQSAIGRGIYNSSVLDGLTNQSLGREARAKVGVDESVARGQADFLERVTETADTSGLPYAQLGMASAQLLADSFTPTQERVGNQKPKARALSIPQPTRGQLPEGSWTPPWRRGGAYRGVANYAF